MKKLVVPFVAIAVFFAAVTIASADSMKLSGNNVNIASPATSVELANGQTYLTLNQRSVIHDAGTGAGNPFDKATMSCMGGCTMAAEDGSDAVCMGSCTGYDAKGDMFNFVWDGFSAGTWKIVGGTGVWEGAHGSGTWEATADMGDGLSTNSWVGEVTLK